MSIFRCSFGYQWYHLVDHHRRSGCYPWKHLRIPVFLSEHEKWWKCVCEELTQYSCFLRLLRWVASEPLAMNLFARDLKSIRGSNQRHSNNFTSKCVTSKEDSIFLFLYVLIGPLNLSKILSPSILFLPPVFSDYDNTNWRMIIIKNACFIYMSTPRIHLYGLPFIHYDC